MRKSQRKRERQRIRSDSHSVRLVEGPTHIRDLLRRNIDDLKKLRYDRIKGLKRAQIRPDELVSHQIRQKRRNVEVKGRDLEVKEEVERLYKREVCRRRSARRASLFAFDLAGKGKGGPKKREHKPESKVRC